MCDKLLRALGPTGRTRGAANARSKIIIMHNLLLFGEHKMQGVIRPGIFSGIAGQLLANFFPVPRNSSIIFF